ncbi:MAG TPA: hypothetical protein VK752_12915 [Bryobacteraceae bacterium]|jgi:hypothetical protein|nr:hypothetical protein [Bryobacteraceae bacterium]
METYDWAWVETQTDETVDVWQDSAGNSAPGARQYSREAQKVNEDAYDEALLEVEDALRPPPITEEQKRGVEDRIVASFAQFSAKALCLDGVATELLTNEFLPIGTSLARWARRFDPALSMADIIQAARNAWTACGLQPLLGVPLALTPSILGYSLLYPYSDNLLDDDDLSGDVKLRFSRRFRRRLVGEKLPPEDHRERTLCALIALIETQYPRAGYPHVFECLLAIHRAQEQSVGQIHAARSHSNVECLRVSCAKGGSSVLADACLAYGSLRNQESRFAFDWGVLLQLGDDLQDVREDLRRRSMTLFSCAAAEGRPLDGLTIQLLNFSDHVGMRMDSLPGGTAVFKALLKMSWRSLIIGAVADSREFYSAAFLREAERFSPFRFDFLRMRKDRLASRQGLYTKLFDALLESDQVFPNGLPSPIQWADWHGSAPACGTQQLKTSNHR